ncbi:MAG: DUF3106 domain-containing protein [Spirochaetia bacterium]|nr:DUF3106 domain-containing protein [Spirochaetia bacterium]
MKKSFLLTAVLVSIFAVSVCAAEKSAGQDASKDVTAVATPKKWEQMTEKEKEEARDAYIKMKDMPGNVKKYLNNGGKKFEELTPKEKEKLKKAYDEWEKFSPQVKENMMAKYRKWQEMKPEEKAKIKEAFKNYNSLTADEKAKVRAEIKTKGDKGKKEAKGPGKREKPATEDGNTDEEPEAEE